jgi:hypothetical protein
VEIDVGYGLWLRCAEAIDARLSLVIRGFSQRFAGPWFPPHLSLVSHFADRETALSAAEVAASRLAGVRLRFESAETTPAFYRALFLRAVDDPALSACQAELALQTAQPEGDFLPHISLFYGELGANRARALAEASTLVPLVLTLGAIEVWRLRGGVEDWERCAAVEMRAP